MNRVTVIILISCVLIVLFVLMLAGWIAAYIMDEIDLMIKLSIGISGTAVAFNLLRLFTIK